MRYASFDVSRMTYEEFPYSYIAIEGNIGSGKTTFTERLGQEMPCNLLLEQFADNPFLPYFYRDPLRYAFPLELFFMTERYKQLQTLGIQGDLFHHLFIADYAFVKTLLFARNNLPADEFRIFQKLWMVLEAGLPKPQLLVYLHRPVEVLLSLIRQRGRSYEKEIKAEYLQQLQDLYFEYFRSESQIPVLIFDLQDADFQNDDGYYQEMLRLIGASYGPGVHHIRIQGS